MLTPFFNTDNPDSRCGHNDHCCHADASHSSGLCLWFEVQQRVRHLDFLFPFILLSASDVIFSRDTLELGSIANSRSKPPAPTSSRIEVSVHRAFEQHLASQKTDHDSSEGSNAQTLHEKPNVSWSVVDDIERGEV